MRIVSLPTPSSPGVDYDVMQVVILQLSLLIEKRPDVVIDLSASGAVEALKKSPFIIKEGSCYQMKVKFRVQHEVITGLRYLQLVKRKGIKVDKADHMMVCAHTCIGDCLGHKYRELTCYIGKLRT